ncbi:Angiopoietin-1 [Microtus ochrogaster]|uniref:Angiopoietin-1 n=1 Tax=Microtus ochrogaster TaxID=79684 RepID=A0A8J6G2M9_MICOH|nr:Angiopoietin-1 [Microtus ochrogaster]
MFTEIITIPRFSILRASEMNMTDVKLENYIVENMKSEMAQIQQNAVQNHTATMLEIGTSLLSQTAEQTRKLTDVETQVLNQTSRLEIQLLENSLSTYKLEKQLLQQTNEILKIHEKNSLLEHKILEMEGKHKEELDTLKEEKENLQSLVTRQTFIIQELEKQLTRATTNNSVLQRQQLELMDTVHNLVSLCTKEGASLKECAFAQIQCKQNPDLQLSTGLSSVEPGVISCSSSLQPALVSSDGSVNGEQCEHCFHLKLIVGIELRLV